MRLPFILTLIPSSLLPLVVGSPSPSITYALLHRFIPHSPSSSIPDYIPYGTIALHHDATNPTYQVIGELINLNDRDPMMDDGQGWYQLGLRVDDQILTTSTRSCYIAAPQTYTFIIHLSSNSIDAIPTSLELGLSYALPTGECPPRWYEPGDRLFLPGGIATKVEVKSPTIVQTVKLAPPPSVDATTGKPEEPPVEKSFLQKYWLPLLGVGIFVATQFGPDEPRRGGAAPAR